MVGTCRCDGSKASGIVAAPPFALNCQAPAGLFVSSHSLLNRFAKKWLLHFVGVWDQMTSGPPVIASAPLPDRKSTRLNSSHLGISYAVFCLKKKKKTCTLLLSLKKKKTQQKQKT